MLKKILSILFSALIISGALLALPFSINATEEKSEAVTYDVIVNTAASITRSFEGNYDSVNPNDNGALSIGCIQWHAGRALSLCRSIVERDREGALAILGEALYNEILDPATVWTNRVLVSDSSISDDESDRISALISTPIGIEEQDKLIRKDVSSYIDRGIGLGITDPVALVYFADLENQCGAGGSVRIAKAAAEIAGSFDKITLDILHSTALEDAAAGKYPVRRGKAYNACLLLEWDDFHSTLEVWTLLSTRYARETPDTSSPLATALYKDANIVVTEKVNFEGLTRAKTSVGWITLDLNSCKLNTSLTGGYVPAPITLDTNGGHFFIEGENSARLSGINQSPLANGLVMYNSDGGYSSTPKIEGCIEAVVSPDGSAATVETVGGGNAMPAEGYVLCGLGVMAEWLTEYIKDGSYIYFDRESETVWALSSYSDYCKMEGTEKKIDLVDQYRPADSLVVYTYGGGFTNAPTNPYGSEVMVDSTGKVLNAPIYGTAGSLIPEGGFVLSGIGVGNRWLYENVKIGDYIIFNEDDNTVTVCQSTEKIRSMGMEGLYNSPIGYIPTPARHQYFFSGWSFTEGGETVTEGTVCQSLLCQTLVANWSIDPEKTLSFDLNGGTYTGITTQAVTGINIQRLSNYLVVYKDKATSGANIYGTEAVVDANGLVTAVYPYGNGNSAIPKNGFVLSGHGTMSQWIGANLKVGMYVTLNESALCVSLYSKELYGAIHGIKLCTGDIIGYLPAAEKEYHIFEGWFDDAGKEYTQESRMPAYNLTLHAKWSVAPTAIQFVADGAYVDGLISSTAIDRTNALPENGELAVFTEGNTLKLSEGMAAILVSSDARIVTKLSPTSEELTVPAGCTLYAAKGSSKVIFEGLPKEACAVKSEGKLSVWSDYDSFKEKKTYSAVYGEKIGTLPAAHKEGYSFVGWTDNLGNAVSADTLVNKYGVLTLYAKWKKSLAVTFSESGNDCTFALAGGSIDSINPEKAEGIALYTAENYASAKDTHSAVIDRSGKVILVSNAPKPEAGQLVLSGSGKSASWIKNNIKVGYYIEFSAFSFKVYENERALSADGNVIYIEKGSALGALPNSQSRSGKLLGWFSGTEQYTAASVINESITLSPKWQKEYIKLTFALVGGSFSGPSGEKQVEGFNSFPTKNGICLYTEYGSVITPVGDTLAVAVDREGRVIAAPSADPVKVPEGGYVVLGSAMAKRWMAANLNSSAYVIFNEDEMKLSVYDSLGDLIGDCGKTVLAGERLGMLPTPEKKGYIFLGWFNSSGERIDENTLTNPYFDPILIARWEKAAKLSFDTNGGAFTFEDAAITAVNAQRGPNELIMYHSKATTGTNIYGTEVAVDENGTVVAIHTYGSGNSAIPENGYVLSGNGTMSAWLKNNFSVGSYVIIDGSNVKVYKNRATMEFANVTEVVYTAGVEIEALPIPTREGYSFAGWYCEGELVADGFVLAEDMELVALWKTGE